MPEISSREMKELLLQLDQDRSWLLQQIDGGRWPELRLDLAALEREAAWKLAFSSFGR